LWMLQLDYSLSMPVDLKNASGNRNVLFLYMKQNKSICNIILRNKNCNIG
ncbi:hypothetical protein NDU88_000730, partial [Pleurodeles waltl]